MWTNQGVEVVELLMMVIRQEHFLAIRNCLLILQDWMKMFLLGVRYYCNAWHLAIKSIRKNLDALDASFTKFYSTVMKL